MLALCFRTKQRECSREWSPHSHQIVGREAKDQPRSCQRLSWTCHGIPYSNTQCRITAREREEEYLSNQEKNRLGQDHGVWNTDEIKWQINWKKKTPWYCLSSQICKGNHKKMCKGQFWPWTLRSWEIKQIPTGTAETGEGETPLSTTWRYFWADSYRLVQNQSVWNPGIN